MLFKEFKDLRRKRDKLRGLPDQLNYAIPIDGYTIALKDGAFLSAFDCSGLDLNSASVEELDAHRAQGNAHSRVLTTASCTTSISFVIRASGIQRERFPIRSARRSTESARFDTPPKSTSRRDAS